MEEQQQRLADAADEAARRDALSASLQAQELASRQESIERQRAEYMHRQEQERREQEEHLARLARLRQVQETTTSTADLSMLSPPARRVTLPSAEEQRLEQERSEAFHRGTAVGRAQMEAQFQAGARCRQDGATGAHLEGRGFAAAPEGPRNTESVGRFAWSAPPLRREDLGSVAPAPWGTVAAHATSAPPPPKINTSLINNVKKLDGLTPHKFETWLRAVKRALTMAKGASKEEFATLLTCTLDDSISDILDTAPAGTILDPDLIVGYLRAAAIPNVDSEKHRLLQRLVIWKQGTHRHNDYVMSFEKLLQRLQISGIRLDESIASFMLLHGLSSSAQRDLILSNAESTDYEKVRKAIMALANNRAITTRERGYGADEDNDDWEDCEDDEDDEFAEWTGRASGPGRGRGRGRGPGGRGGRGGRAPGRGRFQRQGQRGGDRKQQEALRAEGGQGRNGERTKCFNCGRQGHWAKDCKQPKRDNPAWRPKAFELLDDGEDYDEHQYVMMGEEDYELALSASARLGHGKDLYFVVDTGCTRTLMSAEDIPPDPRPSPSSSTSPSPTRHLRAQ